MYLICQITFQYSSCYLLLFIKKLRSKLPDVRKILIWKTCLMILKKTYLYGILTLFQQLKWFLWVYSYFLNSNEQTCSTKKILTMGKTISSKTVENKRITSINNKNRMFRTFYQCKDAKLISQYKKHTNKHKRLRKSANQQYYFKPFRKPRATQRKTWKTGILHIKISLWNSSSRYIFHFICDIHFQIFCSWWHLYRRNHCLYDHSQIIPSSGLDGIPAKFLKPFKGTIAPILAMLFN